MIMTPCSVCNACSMYKEPQPSRRKPVLTCWQDCESSAWNLSATAKLFSCSSTTIVKGLSGRTGRIVCGWQVLDVGCGSNYLFKLTKRTSPAGVDSSNSALGKLEIKWRGSLGEVGRLQTQQILSPPVSAKVSGPPAAVACIGSYMQCKLFAGTCAMIVYTYSKMCTMQSGVHIRATVDQSRVLVTPETSACTCCLDV